MSAHVGMSPFLMWRKQGAGATTSCLHRRACQRMDAMRSLLRCGVIYAPASSEFILKLKVFGDHEDHMITCRGLSEERITDPYLHIHATTFKDGPRFLHSMFRMPLHLLHSVATPTCSSNQQGYGLTLGQA